MIWVSDENGVIVQEYTYNVVTEQWRFDTQLTRQILRHGK